MNNEVKDTTEKPGFDYRTEIRDPKTGKPMKLQPYRMSVSRETGVRLYRDGIEYTPDGTVISAPQTQGKSK